jgi:hypothetical protein
MATRWAARSRGTISKSVFHEVLLGEFPMARQRGVHLVYETHVDGAPCIVYRLLGQIDGRGYFAEVCFRKDTAQQGQQIIFGTQQSVPLAETRGYNALHYADNNEYCDSVAFGIYYALANHEAQSYRAPWTITVLHIGEIVVDTTLDTIAYTAALATWKLFQLVPRNEPYIKNHKIHFPGEKPNIIISNTET